MGGNAWKMRGAIPRKEPPRRGVPSKGEEMPGKGDGKILEKGDGRCPVRGISRDAGKKYKR